MAQFKNYRVDNESLEFIINHVFLPPQLPQTAEEYTSDRNKALLQVLYQSSDYYARNFNQTSIWPTVVRLVDRFRTFENNTSVSAQDFATAVERMQDRDAVGIHVTSQNAGLVLRRIGNHVVFTSFEASPTSAAVTEATGKLLISYPGPAIRVEWGTVVEATFLKRFSEFVETMKSDTIIAASGRGMKAGETLQEDREIAHPRFITEMLTGILRGVGQAVETERFTKRIGDEVLWDKTILPWRRSPLWLVVRVSLRMVLGQEDYKSFMIFFMAQVLALSTQRGVKADRLFVMNAKLARRVHKLQERLPAFVQYQAEVTVEKACKHIQGEWAQTQRSVNRNPWRGWGSIFYKGASFEEDTIITMSNSRDYVKGLRHIICAQPDRRAFTPAEETRIYNRGEWWIPKTSLFKDSKASQDMMLADFERWVMECLNVWLNSYAYEDTISACNYLGGAIQDYMEVATVAYKGNPERNSIMILTVMELWVVLDKLVVDIYPLLLQYSPELNESFLCALLLPESQQRVRLFSIENYIKQRRSGVLSTSVSVFSKELTEHDTFSVCYFRSSDDLVQLEKKIIDEATIARQRKIFELAQKQAEYDNLLAVIRTMTCDYFTHRRDGWTRHDRYCKKCVQVKKADAMRIEVHEWPLPDDPLARAATVFELQCPRPFSIWREATFRILNDLFTPSSAPPSPWKTFANVYTYSGLKDYSRGQDESPRSTLSYTSMTKSFLSSHYRNRRLPTTEDEICVRNALNFALYDTKSASWTSERPPAIDCRHLCTFQLPNGPYESLRHTVTGTSHTPNQVLAHQFKCPPELQLHEYVAFGLLRSGWRIQWLNMLRELRSRTLTFSAEPVNMLYLQAAWQVGPSGHSEVQRESHIEPGEEEFGRNLINELGALLKGVEENWQEVTTAQTMIVLAIQVLRATKSEDVASEAVNFLKEARRVCLVWTRELAEKLPECDLGEVRESQLRVIQMAATCRMTYDVEGSLLPKILQTTHDVAVYVECATTIHYNLPGVAAALPEGISRLLVRDTRMSYAIEEHLRQLVVGGCDGGINLKPIWSAYKRETSWSAMECPNERWVYTSTAGGEGREIQEVHYNLISGELLVEGVPLGRMPAAYTNHVAYKELFKEKVLDVYPSDMSDMIFQTKHPLYDYKVYFAMQEPENELIIRTEYEKDSTRYQFIPSSKLDGDFPANIISSHVFWLELPPAAGTRSGCNPQTGGKIHLRNRSTPWFTKEGVYISNIYDKHKTELRLSDDKGLIDVRSPSANAIATVFAPLETEEYIEVTYGMSIVRIQLPRLMLDFSVDRNNSIECKQFPNMVIDGNQSIGTFIGLQNFLVVRQGPVRSVIIPHGKIILDQQDNHTSVKVDVAGMERIKYHVYTLNPILGTVVGNGSLTNHLYKIYLHAVTSHCLPDPFTGRTGTEEALTGLRAAATMSFQRVETGSLEAELFRLISKLTPIREYYPKHLKRMQHVKWVPGLPPLAQHEEFCKIVKEVSQYAQLLSIFGDVGGSILSHDLGAEDLTHKAAKRNAIFRTEQFGGNMAEGKMEDRIYAARDMVEGSMDEARVAYVAQLVTRWQRPSNVHQNLLGFLEKYREVRGYVTEEVGVKMQLGYSHRWLDPNPAEVWVALYNALRGGGGPSEKYDWLFILTALTYSGNIDLEIIEALVAFGTVGAFKTINPPMHSSYDLSHGYEPNEETLCNAIKTCVIDFEDSEESKLDIEILESEQAAQQRRSITFQQNKEIQARNLACELRMSWPSLEIDIADETAYPLYDIADVFLAVEPCYENWIRNSKFREHILDVQTILNTISNNQKPVLSLYHFTPCEYSRSRRRSTIRLSDLLTRPPPTLPRSPNILARNPIARDSGTDSKPKDHGLEDLLRDFQASHTGKFQKIYTQGLERSIRAFQNERAPPDQVEVSGLVNRLKALRRESQTYMWAVFAAIQQQLAPRLESGRMASQAGLWPRFCPMLFLQQLATNCTNELSPGWKKVFTTYALAVTTVQRLDRLIRISPKGMINREISSDFLKELENTGHEQWDPYHHPDWLLIEIENNLLIRQVQASIASQMIAPPKNSNKIMQLCMGEGKTSVIVPIVAASLADTEKLVRVVVLKPLSGQMFQTLVQKLGGLVNRRIFFMPFSRGIAMGKDEIKVVKQLYNDCLKGRGVLLVQPEHILSFKLLGLEWLYNSTHEQGRGNECVGGTGNKYDRQVAGLLLETQRWLNATSRDILDESDEILNVKHELIYTIGNPAPIQNHPDRWIIIQEIFDLIKEHFNNLEISVQDFEMERHTSDPARFGSIRILDLTAGRSLLNEVAQNIIEDQLLTVSFRLFPANMRALATKFISDASMTRVEAALLLRYFDNSSMASDILYLLRGLIAHNILLFALKEKRWKVDYGLDLKRSLLAVPYRAKDSPSGKAEFSHPDVAITLTCLSYYYGGLDEKQLETCFRNLYKSDNPSLQYERWIKGVVLPKAYLQRLNGINLEDRLQWKKIIYPTFRFNKAVIDSYLSGVVFPKEAKEFPYKLSTSGWDVAVSKAHPTTGFSGTNDNRYLLPLSIEQFDTKEQMNTNARVLSYLLQDGNHYKCIAGGPNNNERVSVVELLKILVKRPGKRQIHVLLDVGAQVLELRNDEVAKTWLNLVSLDTLAAVYFDDNDVLTVVTRDGNIEPLMVSAFADRLDRCLVYLDEAHTRGTDLKLPIMTRAAVTLGPNLTKDRLVQACMRMRKLGNGHTVLFCGPPEIDRKIMEIAKEDNRDAITVRDVLYWCMQETCENTRKLFPIWAKQGINYHQHLEAWNDIGDGKEFPEELREKESKTLIEHYGFRDHREETIASYRVLGATDGDLIKILDKCESLGVKSFRGARMLEEQERELAHEAECERENQRPDHAGPAKHAVSEEVKQFILTGTLQKIPRGRPKNIVPAFSVLENTSANKNYQPTAFSQRLLATVDFCRVVDGQPLRDNKIDDFLRPVNWIVSSTVDTSILLILSPYEVSRLLPDIRKSSKVLLHMYSPQVTRATPSYDLLDFCTIPSLPSSWQPDVSLIDQLNIFAGQLYFRDYATYERVCGFLGLHLNEETSMEKRSAVNSDGFVSIEDREIFGMNYQSLFVKSPVTLLRELVGFRRKGQSYIATHMGHIVHGRFLTGEDFEAQEIKEDVDAQESEEDVEEQDSGGYVEEYESGGDFEEYQPEDDVESLESE